MGCAASNKTLTASVPKAAEATPAETFFDKYTLGVKLGRGAFAQVRTATKATVSNDTVGASNVAVKILDLRDKEEVDRTDKHLQKTAYTEATVWVSTQSHNNVVRLYEVFYDESFCYFVMEKCLSSLFAHLEKMVELNERSVGSVLLQMFTGLSHVHSVKVVHRDVKPDNFLVGGEFGTTVKLSDFGLSAALPKEGKVKGCYGTAPFMCPEMLKGKYYNETADVWSMAVLAYCLFYGDFPYVPKVKNSKAMKQAVVDGKPPSYEPAAPCSGQSRSMQAMEFVQALMERNADERPTANHALRMPFMVAVAQNQHLDNVELPSLRPMIYAGKKAGAFELRDPAKELDIDPLLKKKQQAKNGVPLPDQTCIQTLCVRDVLGKNCGPQDRGNWQTTKSWQNAKSGNSLNSNVWDNISSFTTTASGASSLQGNSSPTGSFAARLPSRTREDSGWSQLNSTPKASGNSAIMVTA